jgi:hypothetical protein
VVHISAHSDPLTNTTPATWFHLANDYLKQHCLQ